MEKKTANLRIDSRDQHKIITLTGVLEYGLLDDAKQELKNLKVESELGYIIDMKNVKNIDSTGFGMIVNFAKRVSVAGKRIVIIVVDDFIRSLFAISQCDKIFPIVTEYDEAKRMLNEDWHGDLSINEY